MIIDGIEYKPVVGFENYYEVSADGVVYSKIQKRFRKPVYNKNNGYYYLVLSDPAHRYRETKPLHRIVIEAWKPENKLECVNHINENKLDNRAVNLEWCTKAYNNTYGHKLDNCKKAVKQIDKVTGKVVAVYQSAREAEKNTKANYKNISAVCRGKRNYAGGYIWRFA